MCFAGLCPLDQRSRAWSRGMLVLAMLAALIEAPLAIAEESLYLMVGESRTIELSEMADGVEIPRAGIIDVTRGTTKRKLIVKGVGRGSTRMTVRLSGGSETFYDVTVADLALLRAAQAQVAKIPGLKAEIRGNQVVVGGQVRSLSAAQRLEGAMRAYPGIIVDASEKDLPSQNAVVKTINKLLIENDLANMQVVAYGKILALQGSPQSEQQKELALRIARMIYPDVEDHTDPSSNGAPPLSIEVVFIEVKKHDQKTIGFQGGLGQDVQNVGPQNGIEGNGLGAKGEPVTRGFEAGVQGGAGQFGKLNWAVGPLSTFLKLIQERSVSRVLSNPKLVTRSGQEANFHSGGTFYLETSRVSQQGVTTIELTPVDYGIKLGILPKIDALGQIDTAITTSITELGEPIAGRESISKSEVKTHVTIRDGQSILLSGLIRKDEKKNVVRVPLLADIPVVGELFKSRQKREEETELLVLVTMSRVQGSDERLHAADRLWDRGGQDVRFSVFD